MAFVDEVTFHARAGRGGSGVVRWLHEKGKEYMGPAGGNGGKGGDVYVEAVRDIGILHGYRNIKLFEAEKGGDGGKKSMDGKTGEDLVLKLPVGSVVTNLDTLQSFDLLKEGERVLVLKGGRYGLGNEHFKGSTNQRPEMTTEGRVGEEADFHIELRLVVDAGFVGFPNAGKSSLLNALTNAKAKVAAYQFTTLEPNLGDLYGFILADIPGLIEGASEGKGLGDKFLRS
ncbi:MAG: GTPase, partial [Candidatus Paceibacterota bacterium]